MLLVSVLNATLEAAFVLSFLQDYWSIQQFIEIRIGQRKKVWLALLLSVASLLFLVIVNLGFDAWSQQWHWAGFLRLVSSYLLTVLLAVYIKNEKLVSIGTIVIMIGLRLLLALFM